MSSPPTSLQITRASPLQVHQGLCDLLFSPCTHGEAAGQSWAHRGWAGFCEHWQGRDVGLEKQIPAGRGPGSRDGQGGRELLMETLLQGRYGHLLAVPCSADAFPQQHPSCLLPSTALSPWGHLLIHLPAEEMKCISPATRPFPTDQGRRATARHCCHLGVGVQSWVRERFS